MFGFRRRCNLILLTLFGLLTLSASPSRCKPLDQYSIHIWRMQEGLPQNIVKSIAQMPDQYIWLGTQEGLARFDGIRFTVYTTRNTPNLASDNIHYLLVDGGGNLWILAGGGLTRYKDGAFTKYVAAGSETDSVLHMWIDRNGVLVAACQNSIRRFENGQLRTVSRIDGIAARNTSFYTPPCSDLAGAVWYVDSRNNICSVVGKQTNVYPSAGRFTRRQARGLCADWRGTIWAAGDQGLFRMDRSGPTLRASTAQFGGRPIREMGGDGTGNVWILTDRSLYRMLGGTISLCGPSINTPADIIRLFIDGTGVCWLKTNNWHEMLRFVHGAFERCLAPEDITQGWEIPLMEARNGDVWIGTVAGICCLQDLSCRTYTTNDGLAESNVRSVCFDAAGRLWVGTTHNGASIMSGARFTAPLDPRLRKGSIGLMASTPSGDMWLVCDTSLYRMRGTETVDMTEAVLGSQPGSTIQSMAADAKGALWLGTATGLFHFDGKSVHQYTDRDGCPTGFVPLVYPDRYGRIWVGGNQSLSCLQNETFTTYSPKDGLPSVPIISMCVDDHDVGWIGSWGEGLYRLKDGKIRRIAVKDGLTANSVQQILADRRGYLWIGSSKGIFRVRRTVLNGFLDGLLKSVNCDVYDDDDGASGGVTSQGNQPSAAIDSHGILWFATMQGLERVVPEPPAREATPVIVEKITINGQVYSGGKPIVAPAGDGSLQVDYTALTYRASHQIVFSYRLEGNDKSWQKVDRRVAYYTNLPPGRYNFLVQAFDREGHQCGAPTVFTFTMLPHFYETVWFRFTCFAAVILLIVGGVWLWTCGLRRRNQELDRKVEQRTQELQGAYEELSNVKAEIEIQNDSLAQANERLAALATEDGLTGLKNHRTFQEHLEQQFLYARRYDCDLSVILMDVDNFKHFNDTYGHPAGDQVLREVSKALTACARETDVVARYGGEEFVVILPHTHRAGAIEVAERCRRQVEEITGLPRCVTGSFGVSTLTASTPDHAGLTTEADNALYSSKKAGKNRVTHFGDLAGGEAKAA